ncbi:maleylpyruvate isomerase family mycothiol-dependent enzyme [Streptantibioticus ferralitis]|uniref:Maleylpyruvate isomerase family mycothiol-dependent enzyme n=1 Tax=Streptantibioticus ferralitis TaxID=236510 RepID=A0ABT5YZE4_9ACTN|nr:maleylpyruvate isomerase family mycothiol-dependent enzyme [Streptantibioticus ferralitis]MDF2256969.1 maleylpyruvate isomerase family mycothiol-dependent enzyme [Streptantibioticus ferralitis]
MSVQRPDPVSDAAAVREATQQLVEAVSALDPPAVAEPSLLAGWSRGHVLTHLARNADAMVNLLTWARTGEETPMYVSDEAREKDIENGASRPLPDQLDDLRQSAERFTQAVDAMPPQAWAAQVRTRHGGVVPAAELPAKRLAEIHLHHVDLGIGRSCADLPADFAARELAVIIDRLTGREGIAAVRLQDTETDETWEIGAAEHPDLTVSGTTHALLAWVSGRSGGEELSREPGLPLPTLPPLG